MSTGCNGVFDWRSSAKTAAFFGLKRNHLTTVKIMMHKSVFLAANGELTSNPSAHSFLLKILGPPVARKKCNSSLLDPNW